MIKIIIALAIVFVIYLGGYYLGYKAAREEIKRLIKEIENGKKG